MFISPIHKKIKLKRDTSDNIQPAPQLSKKRKKEKVLHQIQLPALISDWNKVIN